ncbi:triose-phosphate isomerase [Nocardiopsis composta]
MLRGERRGLRPRPLRRPGAGTGRGGLRRDRRHRAGAGRLRTGVGHRRARPRAAPEEIAPVHRALAEEWGDRTAGVLYGGSVTPANAPELLMVPGVGGLFAGRSAWRVEGYLALLEAGRAHLAPAG